MAMALAARADIDLHMFLDERSRHSPHSAWRWRPACPLRCCARAHGGDALPRCGRGGASIGGCRARFDSRSSPRNCTAGRPRRLSTMPLCTASRRAGFRDAGSPTIPARPCGGQLLPPPGGWPPAVHPGRSTSTCRFANPWSASPVHSTGRERERATSPRQLAFEPGDLLECSGRVVRVIVAGHASTSHRRCSNCV